MSSPAAWRKPPSRHLTHHIHSQLAKPFHAAPPALYILPAFYTPPFPRDFGRRFLRHVCYGHTSRHSSPAVLFLIRNGPVSPTVSLMRCRDRYHGVFVRFSYQADVVVCPE